METSWYPPFVPFVRPGALAFVVTTVLVMSSVAVTRTQTPPAKPGDTARQAADRVRELQAEADRLAAQTKTVLNELRALELQRAIKTEEFKRTDAALQEASAALDATATRVRTLEAGRLGETPGVRERLVEIYKRGRSGYLRLLLSGDLQALGRLARGVASVARLDTVRVETHRKRLRDERAALADLERRRQQLAAAQAASAKARQALDRAVEAHNHRLDELDKQRDLAASYMGELERSQNNLQRTVDSLGTTAGTVLPIRAFRGKLEWPVRGRLVTQFGRNTAGRFGTAIVRNGIEIAATEGTVIRAVHGGTVAFAAPFSGYGTLVIVDHGQGAFTLYGHLTEASVTRGARVAAADAVGRAGRTPAGVGAAYFELRIDGRPVDPVQWLRSTR